MPDRFESYGALARCFTEGRDFIVELEPRDSPVTLLAPHGGSIEPGTTEIASAIAGQVHSLYSFTGLLRRAGRTLHLTSHRFDEPRGLALVAASEHVVAVHGYRRDALTTYVGGRDARLGQTLLVALCAAGFEASDRPAPHLAGVHPDNICNRGRRRAGVQLELCLGLRRRMFADLSSVDGRRHKTADFDAFVAAVAGALATVAIPGSSGSGLDCGR